MSVRAHGPRPGPGIDDAFVPRRNPAVDWVELDGEAVLYEERTNDMHVLNPTAALIWACLDGKAAVGEVASDLSEATAVDHDTILRDVTRTVKAFAENGLLAGFELPATPPVPNAAATEAPERRVLAPPPDG